MTRLATRADVEPETDLVLDPGSRPTTITRVLGKLRLSRRPERLSQPDGAWPTEKIPFPVDPPLPALPGVDRAALLEAIAATPDPDSTLVNSEQGQRFAGRQRRAVGAVQLQSAHAAAVRAAVRLAARTCRAS